ncbi:hypothetical protein GCM10025868_25850 [Angustibacter aerolatus]|uniref:Phospholipid/glycerol acyltransferase domain-containing protein n=1 Tax=Angustibacter aerolatus TaxID=1162965 RepID=A0ABQ6JJC4_9ACTN|nr:lysophospholipid acyltransferase family protein [Angustibacter aerolatus]GMA87335.1 hypothetical protein GCM10025868_25850 [Angustibacter aerolatus]
MPRSAEQFVQPRHTEPFPTAWARSRAASAVRSGIQVAGLRPVIRGSVKPTVHGLDVLDDLQGPVVFVANHTSHLDTPLILTSLPAAWRRRTSVAAAADYFFDTWWRATASAMVFNTFPIERRSGSLSSTPGSLLENGWSLVVFPEGTRSPDGWTRPFKHGAAFLSLRHKVPVVPIALRGSYAAMPRGRNWPVPGRQAVTVRFGRPLFPAEGEGPRDLGERVERAVAQPARRGRHHLVGRRPPRRRRHHAVRCRPRHRRLAPGVGADEAARGAHAPARLALVDPAQERRRRDPPEHPQAGVLAEVLVGGLLHARPPRVAVVVEHHDAAGLEQVLHPQQVGPHALERVVAVDHDHPVAAVGDLRPDRRVAGVPRHQPEAVGRHTAQGEVAPGDRLADR